MGRCRHQIHHGLGTGAAINDSGEVTARGAADGLAAAAGGEVAFVPSASGDWSASGLLLGRRPRCQWADLGGKAALMGK